MHATNTEKQTMNNIIKSDFNKFFDVVLKLSVLSAALKIVLGEGRWLSFLIVLLITITALILLKNTLMFMFIYFSKHKKHKQGSALTKDKS